MNLQDNSRALTRLMWAAAACWLALELAAYVFGGPASWLAARVWALAGLSSLVLGMTEIGGILRRLVRHHPLLTATTVAFFAIASFWGIAGTETVLLHHEATQQVAIGLDAWSEPGWHYTKTGFLGYPARQYLLVSLPALLMGSSLITLRLGYALLFVFGAGLFGAGLTKAFKAHPRADQWALTTTLALLSFPFLLEHVRFFEQTIVPISLTLAATGWVLIARHRRSPLSFLALAWSGAMLGTSYTPSLASWILLNAALLWLATTAVKQDNRPLAGAWLAVLSVVIGFGLLSFASRTDLLHGDGATLVTSPVSGALRGLAIFFVSHPQAFLAPVLALPVIAFIALAVIGRLGTPSFVLAVWCLAVVSAAGVLHGYAAPPPDLGMHRALVIVPPILLACAWWVVSRLKPSFTAFAVVVGLLVVHNTAALFFAIHEYSPTVRDALYADLIDQAAGTGIKHDDPVTLVLLDNSGTFDNADDFTQYLFPEASLVVDRDEIRTPEAIKRPFIAYVKVRNKAQALSAWRGHQAEIFQIELAKRTVTYRRVVATSER